MRRAMRFGRVILMSAPQVNCRLSSSAPQASVTHIEFLRGACAAGDHAPEAELLLELCPHGSQSVLLGDPIRHAYDRIAWRRYRSAADASQAVSRLSSASAADAGCLVLRVEEATPAALQSLKQGGGATTWADTAPRAGEDTPSPCPFVNDPTAQPAAWQALHDAPSAGGMVAMNLLRVPTEIVDEYAAYSSHFGGLASKYGLRVLAAATVPAVEQAVVLGSLEAGTSCPTMAVAVGFPSSRIFASAWSDEAIQQAYKLRASMYDQGFEHIWLRCDE